MIILFFHFLNPNIIYSALREELTSILIDNQGKTLTLSGDDPLWTLCAVCKYDENLLSVLLQKHHVDSTYQTPDFLHIHIGF